jgi:hypothetical protein
MEELARRQHAFWFGFLFWFIGVAVVLSVVSAYAGKAASWLMPAVGYGSFLVTVFALLSRVRGLQCPHCHRRAGANPMQRYKFLFCNACGERIECRQPSSVDSS